MIRRIIDWSVDNRVLVVLITLMAMRQLMRSSLGCRVCMMRDQCPNVGPDPRRTVKVSSPEGSSLPR